MKILQREIQVEDKEEPIFVETEEGKMSYREIGNTIDKIEVA